MTIHSDQSKWKMNTDNDADFYFDFATAYQKMLLNGYRGDFGGRFRDVELYDSTDDNEEEWRKLCVDMWAPEKTTVNVNGVHQFKSDSKFFKEQVEHCRFYPEYGDVGEGTLRDGHDVKRETLARYGEYDWLEDWLSGMETTEIFK